VGHVRILVNGLWPPYTFAILGAHGEHMKEELAAALDDELQQVRNAIPRHIEVERVGLALMKLEEKVHDLASQFGLQPSDSNINLGPLGDLL
jgi:hypothetical protein